MACPNRRGALIAPRGSDGDSRIKRQGGGARHSAGAQACGRARDRPRGTRGLRSGRSRNQGRRDARGRHRGHAEPDRADPAPAASSPTPTRDTPQPPSDPGTRVQHPTRLQQIVARRMAEAMATIPHFQVQTEVTMDDAIALRAQLKAAAGDGAPVPSINDLIVKACALTLPGPSGRQRFIQGRRFRAPRSGATSASRSRPTMAWSWPRSATRRSSRWVRSRARAGVSPSGSGRERRLRPSSPVPPSRSRISGCSG